MSQAPMMGRVVTPARILMSAALLLCELSADGCELSADGCGGPANWVTEQRGDELDSGNAIKNVGVQVP